jgi:hypothetical protein
MDYLYEYPVWDNPTPKPVENPTPISYGWLWICRPDGQPYGLTTGLGQRFALPTYPRATTTTKIQMEWGRRKKDDPSEP